MCCGCCFRRRILSYVREIKLRVPYSTFSVDVYFSKSYHNYRYRRSNKLSHYCNYFEHPQRTESFSPTVSFRYRTTGTGTVRTVPVPAQYGTVPVPVVRTGIHSRLVGCRRVSRVENRILISVCTVPVPVLYSMMMCVCASPVRAYSVPVPYVGTGTVPMHVMLRAR